MLVESVNPPVSRNPSPLGGEKPTVFIHTNDQQMLAAMVSARSLKSRSKSPHLFDVRLLRLEETAHLYHRHNQEFVWWEGDGPSVWRRQDMQSFAPLRRMVPSLLGFQGRALLLDPDVFAVGDVYDLLSRFMEGKAIRSRLGSLKVAKAGFQYSSAVMLLDCSQLTHWHWEQEIDDLFTGRLKLGPWMNLMDESPDRIGHFEEEWNHLDTLTEKTRLLHNSRILTQPWKTGLPADFHEHAPQGPLWLEPIKRAARQIAAGGKDRTVRYLRHPDPRQEQYFFKLLKECLDQGSITPQSLRQSIRKNHLRKDAFALLGLPRS